MRNKIVIYVQGGNVQEVRTSKPDDTDVIVFDVDHLEGVESMAQVNEKYEKVSRGTTEIEYV